MDEPLAGLRARIAEVAARHWSIDADAVLLGCTELPVLFPGSRSEKPMGERKLKLFSSTDILAKAVVQRVMSP